MGRYEGMPVKGGCFLGQTGGALRRQRPSTRLRSTMLRSRRVVKTRENMLKGAQTHRPLKPFGTLKQGRKPLRKVVSTGRRGTRKAMSMRRKAHKTAKKSGHVKQVKETMQDIVGKKLTSLGNVIKQKASDKIHELEKKAGEHAVQAIARRGKRVLEDMTETAQPQVKRRRLNAIPHDVGIKKGYLSGSKQYGGARLF